MEKTYAQALARSIGNGISEEAAVSGLVAHLARQGRSKLLPGILREMKRLAAAEAKLAPTVEVARAEDAETALSAARAAGINVSEASVNPSLVRGWRARSGSRLIDRSGKQALVDLYQRITN